MISFIEKEFFSLLSCMMQNGVTNDIINFRYSIIYILAILVEMSRKRPWPFTETLFPSETITIVPAINLRGVLFPEDSTELFYLHVIASGFQVMYIARLEIT